MLQRKQNHFSKIYILIQSFFGFVLFSKILPGAVSPPLIIYNVLQLRTGPPFHLCIALRNSFHQQVFFMMHNEFIVHFLIYLISPLFHFTMRISMYCIVWIFVYTQLLVHTLVPQCNTQRKWRSCSQLGCYGASASKFHKYYIQLMW